MLRANLLPRALSQGLAEAAGITACLLLDTEGSIVASAGCEGDKELPLIAAVVCNVWTSYQSMTPSSYYATHEPNLSQSQESDPEAPVCSDLQCMIVDCEHGRLAIAEVPRMVLCLVSGPDAHHGFIKARLLHLKGLLTEPLSRLEID
eukprot:NODE_1946_length_861_cov_283.428571_g1364_i0.p1 GENE.NODE_1946_length_861_cov_283.428571_g1364_i0~~NODE_1946_length_861_cov_283.428571_g1364_i0.p1  ORF type:complete len:148 (+),score=54.98 NODE_1946_length_861_cov_283.428571_g1364_i0:127-570(+)